MLDWPDSPVVNDVFTSGDLNWQWDGVKWKPYSVPFVQGEVLGNPNALAGPAVAAMMQAMVRAAFGDGTAGDALTAGGTGIDPAWAAASTTPLPSIGSAQVLGNAGASPALAAGTAFLAVLRRALGDGTAGQAILSGGTGVDPAWADLPAAVKRYEIGCYVPGVPAASQILLNHPIAGTMTIPADGGAYDSHTSTARGTTVPTANTVVKIQKATNAAPTSFSDVGTITFAAAAVVGTYSTSGSPVSFASGDTLRLLAPATPDVAFAGFSATLVGIGA